MTNTQSKLNPDLKSGNQKLRNVIQELTNIQTNNGDTYVVIDIEKPRNPGTQTNNDSEIIDLDELTKLIAHLHRTLIQERTTHKDAISTMQIALDTAHTKINTLTLQLSETNTTLQRLITEQTKWEVKENKIKATIRKANIQNTQLANKINELESEIATLQNELSHKGDIIDARQATIDSYHQFKNLHRNCSSDISEANDQIDMLQAEVIRLRDLLIQRNEEAEQNTQPLTLANKTTQNSPAQTTEETTSPQNQSNELQTTQKETLQAATHTLTPLDKTPNKPPNITTKPQTQVSTNRNTETQLEVENGKLHTRDTADPPPETRDTIKTNMSNTSSYHDSDTQICDTDTSLTASTRPTPNLNNFTEDTTSENNEPTQHPLQTQNEYPETKHKKYLGKGPALGVHFYVSRNYFGSNPIENYRHRKNNPYASDISQKPQNTVNYQNTRRQKEHTTYQTTISHHQNDTPRSYNQSHNTAELTKQNKTDIKRLSEFEQNTKEELHSVKTVLWGLLQSHNTTEPTKQNEIDNERLSELEQTTKDELHSVKNILAGLLQFVQTLNKPKSQQDTNRQNILTCGKCNKPHYECECS